MFYGSEIRTSFRYENFVITVNNVEKAAWFFKEISTIFSGNPKDSDYKTIVARMVHNNEKNWATL